MSQVRVVSFVTAVAFLLSGCGPPKLNVEKDFEVDFFNNRAFGPQILPTEQTVKVTVTADMPVDVYCFTGVNEAVAVAYNSEELKTKAVVAKVGVTSESINFKVPANTQGVVVIHKGKSAKATGKIRLTN